MSDFQSSLIEKIIKKKTFDTTIGGIIPAKKILVFAPHQDDEVLGCGGTILKYLDKDVEIVIVYITDGRYGLVNGNSQLRKEEALDAWKDYTLSQIFLDFEDSHIDSDAAAKEMARIIQSLKPDVIFVPWVLDIHIDHRTTAYCLSCALTAIQDLEVIISSYEIMSPLYSNKVINISKKQEEKTRLIEAYKSQTAYLNLREIIQVMGSLRAQITQLKSFEAAEAFFVCSSEDYKNIMNQLF